MQDDEVSAESLIERLAGNNGRFEAVGRPEVLDRWVAAGRRARRLSLIPDGFRLEVHRRHLRAYFSLVPGAHPMSREHHESIEPISVPERLNKLHPVVQSLRDGSDLAISKPARIRALRIIQGLVVAAEARGHSIHSGSGEYACAIELRRHQFGVRIREQHDRIPHIPTATERRESDRNRWIRIPDFDPIPSGRLTIELDRTWSGRQYRWADGKRLQVEDRLGHLLAEIEVRALQADEREAEAERRRLERAQQWKMAMDRAKSDFREHARSTVLSDQASSWLYASRLRDYCAALEVKISDSSAVDGTVEWIEWARSFADSVDPVSNVPTMPVIPEPSSEDLRPFLHGWSPYGP